MTQPYKRTKQVVAPKSSGKKFLIFTLDKEEYAIDILKVQEIKPSLASLEMSHIVNVPSHIKGIAYLHGNIIPLVDLRIYYRIRPDENNDSNVLIILNLNNKFVGIVVDNVLDIQEITSEQTKVAPEFCSIINRSYIQGIGVVSNRLLIMLDIEKLIFSSELHISNVVEKT